MSLTLPSDDIQRIAGLLSDEAVAYPVGPTAFFRNLVQAAALPPQFRYQIIGTFTGAADLDARNLVMWAVGKGGNPAQPGFTTLGSLLTPLLPQLGVESGRIVAAEIIANRLITDPVALADLMDRYGAPRALTRPAPELTAPPAPDRLPEDGAVLRGPRADARAFEWRGPTEAIELQAFWPREPDFLDFAFLIQSIRRAAAVCLIELPAELGRGGGTGFLIGPTLALTAYHVIRYRPEEDALANARAATLRWNKITSLPGQATEEHAFRLAPADPIVAFSPTDEHDFALLRVEDAVMQVAEIQPAPFTLRRPAKGSALNIIQHPEGGALKLAISPNGVAGIFPDIGALQYTTRTAGGSSGAPCFNDAWEVVGLHALERLRSFGAIREGILFEAIHRKIASFL